MPVSPSRLWYIASKYWRMNPCRLWWIGHIVDEWKTRPPATPASPSPSNSPP